MAQRNDQKNIKNSGSLSDWILPLFLLFFLPPAGLILVIMKLLGSDSPRKRQVNGRHPYYTQERGSTGARTTMSEEASFQARQEHAHRQEPYVLTALERKSKRLRTLGAVLTILFGFSSLAVFAENLWMLPDVLGLLEELLPSLCITAGGAGMWMAGKRQKKALSRFRQYLAMIGQNKYISIPSLAAATSRSPQEVREDLQKMLDEGYFPTGFLDYGGDQLVLSTEGLDQTPPPKEKKISVHEAENAVLAEIRAVNDAISHPGLSAQIDRIGVITAKIFDFQKSHPQQSPQLHSFLSYYLPTTLKILRAYAQLEAQGIEGENITAAKQRIEGMMDKVVEGFEKQLDQLFQGDTMDITTDVKVLEQMLAKDGLSSGDGLRLGL